MKEKFITFPENYKAPTKEELKGREYCKYHDFHNHSTNNCWAFKNMMQDRINKGVLKFPEKKKTILVDEDPFPPVATVNKITFDLRSLINHKRRMWEEIQIEVLKEIQVEVLKEIPPKFGDTMSEAAYPLEEVKKKRFEEENFMILRNLKKSIYWLSSANEELHKRNIKEHLSHYVGNDGKAKAIE